MDLAERHRGLARAKGLDLLGDGGPYLGGAHLLELRSVAARAGLEDLLRQGGQLLLEGDGVGARERPPALEARLEHPADLGVGREVVRLLAARRDEALVRVALDEQPHAAHRRAPRRVVQRAEAIPVGGVHLGLRSAQQFLHAHLGGAVRRPVQRRALVAVGRLGVRPCGQEGPHAVDGIERAGAVHGSEARPVARIHVGLGRDERVDARQRVVGAGPVQRRPLLPVDGVHVDLELQQPLQQRHGGGALRHAAAVLHRQVQRAAVLLVDLRHRRAGVEQQHGAPDLPLADRVPQRRAQRAVGGVGIRTLAQR
mmetsp:Transcript_17691/g.42030  ORF Transcript_17691/g.42030 Transcript_17691/m.42030 type:complete len:312 (+) Transcript_17691:329-1264(+)